MHVIPCENGQLAFVQSVITGEGTAENSLVGSQRGLHTPGIMVTGLSSATQEVPPGPAAAELWPLV